MSKATKMGSALRAAREKRGDTQEEAAARVGVRGNTWARWERDEHAPTGLAVRRALARYLSTS